MNVFLSDPRFAGIETFKSKVWLSSPTMHGDEQRWVDRAIQTNWVSTVGENIDVVEKMMAEYKQPTREEVIQYLAVYMSHARKGNTYVMSPARLNDDNLVDVAASMYRYFEEMKHE